MRGGLLQVRAGKVDSERWASFRAGKVDSERCSSFRAGKLPMVDLWGSPVVAECMQMVSISHVRV